MAEVAVIRKCPHTEHEGERDIAIDQFGICRARPDGLNLYCKTCINRTISKQRAEARQMKRDRERARLAAQMPLQFDLPPIESKLLPSFRTTVVEVEVSAPERKPMVRAQARKLSPAERVLAAITSGARTQATILLVVNKNCAMNARLTSDMVGDALADLLLWKKKIGTDSKGAQRVYFPLEAQGAPPAQGAGGPMTFSTIRVLMPQRKAS